MEQRRLMFGIALAMAIILLWQPAFFWLGTKLGYDMKPRPIASTTQPDVAPATSQSSEINPTTVGAINTSDFHPAPAGKPSNAKLGSPVPKDPKYAMALAISPQGAGLDSVTLNRFNRAARTNDPYVFQEPYPNVESETRVLGTPTITIDGQSIDLSKAQWSLESFDLESASYSLTIDGPAAPAAKIVKTFHVLQTGDPSKGYEIAVTHSFENLSDRPIKISASINGPTIPPRESDRGGDRQVLSGYDNHGYIEVGHDMIESFSKDHAQRDLIKDANGNPLVWAGAMSIYFQAIVLPQNANDPNSPADYVQRVTTRTINPEARSDEHEIAMRFETNEFSIAPGGSITIPLRVFLGPRQRGLLESSFYSSAPRNYDDTLVLTSGFCGFLTFQWLVSALVALLGIFYTIFRDWGLAIIGLVILVRALLHPVTKRSQISMSKMSRMGPELEKLKKKHGDDKDELNRAMMEFYKTQGIAPVLGCLPMFLQMPIWLALWQSLQSTFELRQAPFLWGFTWIHDLSKPDHLIELAHPFSLFGFLHVSGLNILPFLLAAVFWVQMKMQPKPAAVTPEQQQQQKMMQWMTLLFPVMLYSGPSGLNLYILTSTGIGIIESKIIRDHIKQREEDEKAGRVIVDAGSKFGRRSATTSTVTRAKSEKPSGRLSGWLATLQERAEQIRREAEKRK